MSEQQNLKALKERTFPLGAIVRMTGLTADTLRAWERRYGVVVPARTPGGTRRYTSEDLERLQLVKAVVDSGRRIGKVASMTNDALSQIVRDADPTGEAELPSDAILAALKDLDQERVERLIAQQVAALGALRFATDVAGPLLTAIGNAWAKGEIGIAGEHMASAVLRSILGASLRPASGPGAGRPLVFGTLPGERHELGLLIAAIVCASAGSDVVYLGPDLPIEDLLAAVDTTGAGAVVLSMVACERPDESEQLVALRASLGSHVEIWLGGRGASIYRGIPGIEITDTFDGLERRVALYGLSKGTAA